jgi:uncharacterized protein YecE (DUF72 family)
MRGLPDSALVGTYKRLHRKPKRKHYASHEENLQNLGAGISILFRVIAFFAKPIAKVVKSI